MKETVQSIAAATRGTLTYFHPIGKDMHALHADFDSMISAEAFVKAMGESFGASAKIPSYSGPVNAPGITVSIVLGG